MLYDVSADLNQTLTLLVKVVDVELGEEKAEIIEAVGGDRRTTDQLRYLFVPYVTTTSVDVDDADVDAAVLPQQSCGHCTKTGRRQRRLSGVPRVTVQIGKSGRL